MSMPLLLSISQLLLLALDSFSNLYPCPDVEGTYTTNWCCGATEGTPESETGCCNTPTFNFDEIGGRGIFFSPDINKAAALTSITTTKASTSTLTFISSTRIPTQLPTPTPTPKHSGSSNHDVVIGVGVGAPIAALAFAALAVLLIREHRRRQHAERTTSDLIKSREQAKRLPKSNRPVMGSSYELNDRRWTQELNAAPPDPMELQSRQIHEAGNETSTQ
ncbi:MAG: hypothetical protein Q9218_005066 [Villophora microphyllina]